MEDREIFIIALVVAFVGLGIIYYGTLLIEPVQMDITEINENHIGQFVQVQGEVVGIKEFGAYILVTLRNESNVSVFSRETLLPEKIKIGDTAQVKGRVAEYNDKLEIIPERRGDLEILK